MQNTTHSFQSLIKQAMTQENFSIRYESAGLLLYSGQATKCRGKYDYEGHTRLFCFHCQSYSPITPYAVKEKVWDNPAKANPHLLRAIFGVRAIRSGAPTRCPHCQKTLRLTHAKVHNYTLEVELASVEPLSLELAGHLKQTKKLTKALATAGPEAVGVAIHRSLIYFHLDKDTLEFKDVTIESGRTGLFLDGEPHLKAFSWNKEGWTSKAKDSLFANLRRGEDSLFIPLIQLDEAASDFAKKTGLTTLLNSWVNSTGLTNRINGFNLAYSIVSYLLALQTHPVLEQMVKGGFLRLMVDVASECQVRACNSYLQLAAVLNAGASPAAALQLEKGVAKLLVREQAVTSLYDYDLFRQYQQLAPLTFALLSKPGYAALLAEWIQHVNFTDVQELVSHHGYTYDELLDYGLKAETKQGMMESTMIHYLRDYRDMCEMMEVTPEKFPKSLSLSHDLMQRNFKYKRDEMLVKQFERVCQRQHRLEFETDDYLIRLPKSPEELVREGEELNHCVASYIQRVANGQCTILFLRDKAEPDTPLLTIEWDKNRVIQARGYSNKTVSTMETPVREAYSEWVRYAKASIHGLSA